MSLQNEVNKKPVSYKHRLVYKLSNKDKIAKSIRLSRLIDQYFSFLHKNKKDIEAQQNKLIELDNAWKYFIKNKFYPFHILYYYDFATRINNLINAKMSNPNLVIYKIDKRKKTKTISHTTKKEAPKPKPVKKDMQSIANDLLK